MNPRALSALDRMNPVIVGLLHTPLLHWLASPGLMTISLRGRRSGGHFRFPVGYHLQPDQGSDQQSNAVLVLVADAKSRQWWRNFESPWPASLQLRGRKREMIGEMLEPGCAEYAERVGRSFRRAAFIPRIFGVDFDRERGLSDEQMKALGDVAAVVCFRPVGHAL